jgi:hypothetical protein
MTQTVEYYDENAIHLHIVMKSTDNSPICSRIYITVTEGFNVISVLSKKNVMNLGKSHRQRTICASYKCVLSAKFEVAVPGAISIYLDCFVQNTFVFGSHNHLAFVAVTRRMDRGKVLYTLVVHVDE